MYESSISDHHIPYLFSLILYEKLVEGTICDYCIRKGEDEEQIGAVREYRNLKDQERNSR